MKAEVSKLYEAMFLIDSAEAAADWDGVITTIKNILGRAEAEIVSIRKWDERRLAYKINGKVRGTYILCYFRADGKRIRDIERDVQLSERIMRVLILSAEHMRQEDIVQGTPPSGVPKRTYGEKDTTTIQTEKRGQKVAQAAVEKTQAEQPLPATSRPEMKGLEPADEQDRKDTEEH